MSTTSSRPPDRRSVVPPPGGLVLVVDDDRHMCEMLALRLEQRGYTTKWRSSGAEALELLEQDDFDVVVTDLNMPGLSGTALCERVLETRPDVPVVVVTAFGSMESAIAAIRAGAYDFITKPFDIDAFALTLERAKRHRALREEVRRLRLAVAGASQLDGLIGDSPAMRELCDVLARIGDSDASVLVTGETGTGKELIAEALHRNGSRRTGPFVAVNCAAMPETLLESELFGHVRGAFTDAKTASPGLFVQAAGGTIFLDEIGELPIALQPKLLRALQERKVRPLGATVEVPFDVRVVAATNRDLEAAIEERLFREDLYFRINVIHVEVPPLRARGADVLLLANSFRERVAARTGKRVTGLTSAAAEKLLAYPWPGNVRELLNCMERAVALTRFDAIAPEDLPEKVRTYQSRHVVVTSNDPSELVTLEELETRYVARVLETVGGNKTLAARILGIERKTLYRKLEKIQGAETEAGVSIRNSGLK
jgi:two-component system response regulator HydG